MPRPKPRGRIPAYGFFLRTVREEEKKYRPSHHVNFVAFSKKCSERWRNMSHEEKSKFFDLADEDKERYETELKNYISTIYEDRRTHYKHVKGPRAPKRPLTAFFWFCTDERNNIRNEYPEFSAVDTAKELGRRWQEAHPTVRVKYQELAENDRNRYEREVEEYRSLLETASRRNEL